MSLFLIQKSRRQLALALLCKFHQSTLQQQEQENQKPSQTVHTNYLESYIDYSPSFIQNTPYLYTFIIQIKMFQEPFSTLQAQCELCFFDSDR